MVERKLYCLARIDEKTGNILRQATEKDLREFGLDVSSDEGGASSSKDTSPQQQATFMQFVMNGNAWCRNCGAEGSFLINRDATTSTLVYFYRFTLHSPFQCPSIHLDGTIVQLHKPFIHISHVFNPNYHLTPSGEIISKIFFHSNNNNVCFYIAASPQWRRGPVPFDVLCNACGTRYR